MADYLRESGVKWIWEKIKTLLSAKQDKLVSGTNIKTINGKSLLGSGDVSIEGGGNFDSSGTYPNLTAGKATKLATARKIGLTGGAVGTATNFDGSGNINIPVTGVYDTYIKKSIPTGGSESWAKGLSLLDASSLEYSCNRLLYCNQSAFTFEYSNDGGATWNNYNLSPRTFFALTNTYNYLYLGNNRTAQTAGQDMFRITINYDIGIYIYLDRILIYLSTNGASNINCHYEYSTISAPDNFINNGIWAMEGYPGWNKLPINKHFGTSYNGNNLHTIRLTFSFDAYAAGSETKTKAAIQGLRFLANTIFSNNTGFKMCETGHLYDYDYEGNATFPANITATKHVTKNGTANQVVLGNGSLRPISELSPITDADAEILLGNHIHSIDVNANGNDVNISVIESSKNGNNWETEDNDIPIPLATTTSAGLMSKDMYSALKDGFIANIVEVTTNGNSVELSYDAAYPNSDGTFNMMEGEGVEIPLATTTSAGVMSKEDKAKLDGGNVTIEPDSGMPDFIGDFDYSSVDYEAIIDLTTVDWVDWVEGGLYLMNAEETWEEDNGATSYHQCVVTFIYRANGCIPLSIVNTNKMTAKMSGMVITINLTEGTGELRFKQIKLI